MGQRGEEFEWVVGHTFSAIFGLEGMPLLGNEPPDWLEHPYKAVPYLHSDAVRHSPKAHHRASKRYFIIFATRRIFQVPTTHHLVGHGQLDNNLDV